MVISLQHSFCFLAIPKCASVSIESMLAPHSEINFGYYGSQTRVYNGPLRHMDFRTYHQFIDPCIRHMFGDLGIEKICVFREPLSWLNSWYRFRRRSKLRNPKDPRHRNSTAHVSYSAFVEAVLSDAPPPFANFRCQTEYVIDDNGSSALDTVFRYEHIDSLRKHMEEKIGKRLVLEKLNVSPTNSDGINGDLKRRAVDHLSRDYEFYDSLPN